MQIQHRSTQAAHGHLALHHQFDAQGQKLISKGRPLTAPDIATLEAHGIRELYVAVLEADDLSENEAAHQLGQRFLSQHLSVTTASTGRVNVMAQSAGVLMVNPTTLLALNQVEGIALATLPHATPVIPKKVVATLKIIPYTLPAQSLKTALDVLEHRPPLLQLRPYRLTQAMLLTIGREATRAKVVDSFSPPLENRLTSYGMTLHHGAHVAETEAAITEALRHLLAQQPEMVLLAGETSIMDSDDVIPRAIKRVGGHIEQYGLPVEPGNLFLLAYHGDIPIVGLPGCARSPHHNVVDMVLPRLATGERVGRLDLLMMGHGGYLK